MTRTLFNELRQIYNIKRLGPPNNYLGCKVSHEGGGSVTIKKPKQVETLLQQTGMQDCNPAKTPLNVNEQRHPPRDDDEICLYFQEDYQIHVGHIRYLAD